VEALGRPIPKALHHEPYENILMAKDKDPSRTLCSLSWQTVEQMTEQTQGAMDNYFGWLQPRSKVPNEARMATDGMTRTLAAFPNGEK
jgi:hypothetical protein